MLRQYELVEKVKAYDPTADEGLLNRAYVYAMQKHGAQQRASGDPYFSHPLEVAGILTDMRLDTDSIITALLHDTIEDTDATSEEIEKLFGANIRKLVEGVTKLTQLELKSDKTKQAENFRKLVLAMSQDIRVLLVKLADRLHNMRTLHFIPKPEKRRRIAEETMEIYAPLAERLGMHDIKDELEELSFAELDTLAHDSIVKRLAFLRETGATKIETIIHQLEADLEATEIKAVIVGREKRPYSIWKKMQHKNVNLEQLSDIIAFRVLVDSIGQCYAALGVIHSRYALVPGRFKDYISIPKGNGYQSLHTTIIGPGNHKIEVQIRTHEMHEVAELGVAAHWVYKQGEGSTDGRQYRWLRELLDLLEQAQDPQEFLEHTKIAMFQDQVFCFSPKGDLVALPRGACPVDFAYAVHSAVGDACTGARVNGRIVPLKTLLENGDQVEIITQKGHQPSPSWEQFVVSAKAKARLRRLVRTERRGEYLSLGRSILYKTIRDAGKTWTEAALEAVLSKFNAVSVEDLLVSLGEGQYTGRDALVALYPDIAKQEKLEKIEQFVEKTTSGKTAEKLAKKEPKSSKLTISGLIPGMAIHFAKCCHPIPGDSIIGVVTTGKGVTVHVHDCENAAKVETHRLLDVGWEDHAGKGEAQSSARLYVAMENLPGALGNVCTLIGGQGANIQDLKVVGRGLDLFEVLVDVQVRDLKHLQMVQAALRGNKAVAAVERRVTS
ncbi:MAG: RelA/SpoT family protein [Holosporales bacterium]